MGQARTPRPSCKLLWSPSSVLPDAYDGTPVAQGKRELFFGILQSCNCVFLDNRLLFLDSRLPGSQFLFEIDFRQSLITLVQVSHSTTSLPRKRFSQTT